MAIRVLAAEDNHAEWLRMRRSLWPDCGEAMHELEMAEQADEPDRWAVLVVDRGAGRLGGFAELSVRARVDGSTSEQVAYLEGWYVDPDLRGRGIGRELVVATERWAVARGLTELASDAELWNEAAIAAHRAVGFRETFRAVHFLKGVEPESSR